MESQTKICQNCKKNFVIEPDDFSFYEKIKVPPPTFCPECRTIRRLCWRNEMSLYKRKCGVSNHDETVISIYHPDEKLNTVDLKYWWSDEWDALDFGSPYDFFKPFFLQWKELYERTPLQCLSNSNATNSDYCNIAEESRDSYMASASWKIERTFYSNRIVGTRDSSDLYIATNSELCYDDVICKECYHLLYSLNCVSCVDSYFLYDCHGCTNCLGCSNLRNKSYCMWNEQLSKEEYNRRVDEYDLKSYKTVDLLKEKFKKLCLNSIHRFSVKVKTINSIGDNLDEVKNCKICFDAARKVEDSKYTHWAFDNVKDVYDCGPGVALLELGYEDFDTGAGGRNILFSSVVYYGENVQYSFNCYGCSNLFGCIGLRNKKYCILNRQYLKEEYEEILPKIKEQMSNVPYVDKKGNVYSYGEFFPSEISPFCYNETQAQDYFPITKNEALENGYKWRDKKISEHQITLEAKNIPDNLKDISDSIIKEVIGCLHNGECQDRCSKAYKITQEELNLYRRLNIPLPRLCFLCRHENRLRMRNPMKLWHRQCMCYRTKHIHGERKCEVEFETSYAPERLEIVYCEKCYQQEVI